MPQPAEMEQKHGSLIAGMLAARPRAPSDQQSAGPRYGTFISFTRGLQTLVEALARRLEGVIRTATPVRRLTRDESGWRLDLADGSPLAADAVVLALPVPQGARLMEQTDHELSRQLSEIACASSVVVNFAFRRDDVPHPLNGFGFIVPAAEGRPLLACTFSSVKFSGRAPDGHILLRCFAGGALRPELCDLEEDALIATCRGQLTELLGIEQPPLFARVSYHRQSMPQYVVGHRDRVAHLREKIGRWPGLHIAGSAFEGVGIPDCIRSGEEAAVGIMSCWSGI
jgi:oxygen-dependent protoporphyrinogen oxidase